MPEPRRVGRATEIPTLLLCVAEIDNKPLSSGSLLGMKIKVQVGILKIITENPYRVLGVTANAPMKERVANQGKMKAFLKVGKPAPFPMDLNQLLPTVNRTSESVATANSQLTLPNDQIKFAQFWFVNASSFDQIAINHLTTGNIDEAIGIWQKKQSASTLQNLVVCYLIKENYEEAVATAKQLYFNHSKEFAQMILGDSNTFDASNLGNDFIDRLAEEMTAKSLLPFIADEDWRQHLAASSVKPIVEALTDAIAAAKATKGKGPAARRAAGTKLMNDTKGQLKELKSLLPKGDLQYQMTADKLGLEILQCGIDYYNDSDDDDAAHKAMVLQKYAQSVVVGQMAKDRCKENVDILNKIISELPPTEVMAEDKAINTELKKYNDLPDKIEYAVTLLKNTKSRLLSIKSKLGETHPFYLKKSTLIVSAALHNIIEEVNGAQKVPTINIGGQEIELPISESDRLMQLLQIPKVLNEAWKATLMMDEFDMEQIYRSKHYLPNRNILKEMCEQFKISTVKPSPKSTQKPVSRPTPKPSQNPVRISTPSSSYGSTPSAPYTSSSSSSKDNDYSGCIGAAAIVAFIIYIYIAISVIL